MSRKFRWFLLAACAFVVLMNGRATIVLLATGPQAQSSTPEFQAATSVAVDKRAATKRLPTRKLAGEGEVARGDARGQ